MTIAAGASSFRSHAIMLFISAVLWSICPTSANAALVQISDIATGEIVAAYPVPPTTAIPIQAGQEVVFVDIPYGDPNAPEVVIEVIGDSDVLVTTKDGTVLIEGLFSMLEYGEEVRLSFADTGQVYGDGPDALTVPEFASIDMFAPMAAGAVDGPPSGVGGGPYVYASRDFVSHANYPPTGYSAYGIIAFPSLPVGEEMWRRFVYACQAYVNVIKHTGQVRASQSEQMITVWPVVSENDAENLRGLGRDGVCGDAVQRTSLAVDAYDLETAQSAIRKVRQVDENLIAPSDLGPFLIAWACRAGACDDKPVLVVNLANIKGLNQFLSAFQKWTFDIEQNPALWQNGWQTDNVKSVFAKWLNVMGTKIRGALGQ